MKAPALSAEWQTFFSIKKTIYISTNNTKNTEKFKIIILKRKANIKASQTQFLNHHVSDIGFKKKIKKLANKI